MSDVLTPESLAWGREQAEKLAQIGRPLIPFTADCINSVDAVIAGIEAGAQRVEVVPDTVRAYAVQECSSKDGMPTGWYDVTEDTRINGAWRTRAVPGTRARSAAKAMDLYRQATGSATRG